MEQGVTSKSVALKPEEIRRLRENLALTPAQRLQNLAQAAQPLSQWIGIARRQSRPAHPRDIAATSANG